jgi:adenylate cyclase
MSLALAPSDETALVNNTRFFGEHIRRLAEQQVEAFRQVVMQPLLSGTGSAFEAVDTAIPIARAMIEVAERTVSLLHRRQVEHNGTEIVVENTELVFADEGIRPRPPGADPSIAFLDLSDSTALTDVQGDTVALEIADGLADLGAVAEAAGGRTVKFLGDGMMLHFADPAAVVDVSFELVDAAPSRGLPPARVGISTGPVLFRDGDYFGRTVIVAARLNALAGPNDVLVSEATAAACAGATFEALGPQALKGIAAPVPVFRARRG